MVKQVSLWLKQGVDYMGVAEYVRALGDNVAKTMWVAPPPWRH